MDNFSNDEQIAVLRGMTKRTEILHEAQVFQLRLWPFATDPGLQSSEANVNFPKSVVTFNWKDSDKPRTWKPPGAYMKRVDRLKESVKFLLGEGWGIEVVLNEKRIYPATKPRAKKKIPKKNVRRTTKRK